MKPNFFILFFIACIAVVNLQAQSCSVAIGYQENPNSLDVAFVADSIVGGGGNATFTWDFGDGTTGSGQQATHAYIGNGAVTTYRVCLTMTNSFLNCNFSTCDSILVPNNATGGCITYVSYTNQDSLYTFSTTNSGVSPFTYNWTVGGQTVGTTGNIFLVIDTLSPGNYLTVCVDVTDSSGCVSSACADVYNSNNGACNTYLTYTNQDSAYTFFTSNTGTGPYAYQWYYNNTVLDTTSTVTLVIDTSLIGATYDVCVYVTDANGCVSSGCITISRPDTSGGGVPCQAYFVIYPDSSNGGQGYYYGYNMSTGNGILNQNMLWDFGDGSTSTDPYPTHTYAAPGNYIVCLMVGVAGTSCYDTYCDSSFYVFKTDGGLMTHLDILGPTGIRKLAEDPALRLFPNPIKDELNWLPQNKEEQVKIFDISGKKVFETRTADNKINLAKLSAGMYFIEFNTGSHTAHNRFLKE